MPDIGALRWVAPRLSLRRARSGPTQDVRARSPGPKVLHPSACSGNAASEPPVALGGVPPQGDAPSEAAGADCAAPADQPSRFRLETNGRLPELNGGQGRSAHDMRTPTHLAGSQAVGRLVWGNLSHLAGVPRATPDEKNEDDGPTGGTGCGDRADNRPHNPLNLGKRHDTAAAPGHRAQPVRNLCPHTSKADIRTP